tara:strand:- start:1987 stop:2157 length:171 start_codon:yes stop_codon:yes gene_type:complete
MKTYDYSNYSDSELGRQLYDINSELNQEQHLMSDASFNRLQAKRKAIQEEQNRRKN